jgi:hypothetical protein
MQDTSRGFQLPDDFIVDLRLTVPWFSGAQPSLFHILKVSAFSQGVIVEVGYNGLPVAISEAIPVVDPPELNRSFLLNGQGDFPEALGSIVIGRLDNLLNVPPGQITFDVPNGRLETTCITMGLKGVSSIRVKNGQDLGPPLTGNVILEAGINFALFTIPLENSIMFNALNGEGLQPDCDCDGIIDVGPPIRTINAIPPDSAGNFTLVPGTCIEINPGTNSLELVETCATPCCGCEELQILADDIELMKQDLRTLENLTSVLEGNITTLSDSFIGSIINPSSCPDPP